MFPADPALCLRSTLQRTTDVLGALALQSQSGEESVVSGDSVGQTIGDAIVEQFPSIAAVPGWRVLVAIGLLALGVWLSKLLVRLLGRPVARRFRRQSVAQTVLRIVRVLTFGVAVLLAMNVLGLQLGNIVLSVTVFSAVVGVILAPLVGNFIGGLFILADEPYEIGDMIELDDDTMGFVDEITIRYTKIFTLDNTFLVLPNSAMRERDVTNYSAEDERTRLSLDLLITYESDLATARDLMERAAAGTDSVIRGGPDIRIGAARYPAKPTCYIAEYGDHGVLLRLRYWAKKPFKLPSIQSAVRTELWHHLENDDVDVEIAYPHQHHVFDETSGRAEVAVVDGDRDHAGHADSGGGPEKAAGESAEVDDGIAPDGESTGTPGADDG
ncbi:MAG: mechanosensitive ion channel family protein [Haloferacaceae archaeon]